MSETPFEQAGSLRIGAVDFVSPDEIKVVLDIEAPESVALNTGEPRPFPRVNGYLLIPVDDGFLVGQTKWIAVERSPFPKRRGMQDFGLVDLPYPLRRLCINPLGTLRAGENEGSYVFRRGADSLPSVGTTVMLPTENQLRAVVESDENRRVKIGTSPLAGDAQVSVDPNRLFGRHLAVLGNTGSGKSCSVAGLIRWSLEQAMASHTDGAPNARFIVLDPNGEYSRAFGGGAIKPRIFKVNPGEGETALKVPLWFWNSAEWCSFTQASARTQRPTLMYALRLVRDGHTEPTPDASHGMRCYLRTLVATTHTEKNAGNPWSSFPKPKNFFEKLEKWKAGLELDVRSFTGSQQEKLQVLVGKIEELCVPRRRQHPNYDFTRQEVDDLLAALSRAHSAFGGTDSDLIPADVDAPRPFEGASLLRCVEAAAEMLNVSEHVETLLLRIRSLLTDTRMKPIMGDVADTKLDEWMTEYIGATVDVDSCVSIIDLSLVPTEVVHVVTAVIARMTFEALQRYAKLSNATLPTVLVMEEAHTFIRRYKEDVENEDAATVCCQVFERIAREGRKFGLGLVLSSQRPSDLSPTVLSQCNTYLLHRISNDRDQQLIERLVPDNLRGLLRELPLLPSQNAILLGWASELPVLVKVNDLPQSQQPRSDDPDFWGVWVGSDEEGSATSQRADWKKIAADWQTGPTSDSNTSEEPKD